MKTIQITLPATVSDIGPGINCLALAVGLHTTVTVSEIDAGLEFEYTRELPESVSGCIKRDFMHAARVIFRSTGRAPSGLRIRYDIGIPPAAGLGSKPAIVLAALMSANELVGGNLSRFAILSHAARLTGRLHSTAACMHGGLVAASFGDEESLYSEMPAAPMQIVVTCPDSPPPSGTAPVKDKVSFSDATANIGHALLVAQALGRGDFELLRTALVDRLDETRFAPGRRIYEHARSIADAGGAAGITPSGRGYALVAFSAENHASIAEALQATLRSDTGMDYVSWILPIDFHGVTVSETGISPIGPPQPATSTPIGAHDSGANEPDLPLFHSGNQSQSALSEISQDPGARET